MATASEAWFKIIHTENEWDLVTLEGIKYVAQLKEAIKKKMAPELDAYPTSRLTIKAKKGEYDDDKEAVKLEVTEELASALKEYGTWLLVFVPSATSAENHRFDLIVEPKWILSISWTVNINTATLNELKEKISKEYYPHLDSTLLKLTLKPKSSKPFSPDSDKDLRVLLRDLVQANEKVLIISVETPQKPFSEWCLSAVKELYGITGEFPKYKYGRAPIVNTKTLPSLLDILNEFSIIIPILPESTEATASLYVHSILNKVAADFLSLNSSSVPGFELASDTLEPIFIIKPQKQVTGVYGKGPVDYAIDLSNGVTVGVTEVKQEENAITKGLVQNAVQIESALWESRKRKRDTCDLDGTDNDEVPNYCFGIVTNTKEWFFLKCTFVNGRTKFMVSRSYMVSYGKESTKNDVEVLAEIIKWLLMEAQSSTTDGRKKAKVMMEMPRSD